MASGKEIRTQIKSIESTQKITKAMEMVAASKMRKTQVRVLASRPYATKMRSVISHLAQANPEYKHDYMTEKESDRIGIIIVSTDRGLCGGLNTNLFKQVLRKMQELDHDGAAVDLCTIGSKAAGFFGGVNANVVGHVTGLSDEPKLTDLVGAVKVMLDAFNDGKIGRLYIAFNDFVNTMTQEPLVQQLLPISSDESADELNHHWDYIYEPDAKEVLDSLLVRYVESLVYQAVVENTASEQAARMVAMKSASDNAGNLIDELNLVYNKARQASITQEISEICAGAAAV